MKTNTKLLKAPADNSAETVAVDLEGTLSKGRVWEGMRDFLIQQGREDQYKRFFLRKMPRYALFKLGLLSPQAMKENWIVDQLRLFAGCSAEQMGEMAQYVIEQVIWPARRPAVVAEMLAHLAEGRRVIVVTGQFEPIVAELLRKMDGLEGIGTPLLFDDGLFTGKLAAPLNLGERKAEQLQPFLRDNFIHAAYGDTAADLPMLRLSASPVAVCPDNRLRGEAERHNWRIMEDE